MAAVVESSPIMDVTAPFLHCSLLSFTELGLHCLDCLYNRLSQYLDCQLYTALTARPYSPPPSSTRPSTPETLS